MSKIKQTIFTTFLFVSVAFILLPCIAQAESKDKCFYDFYERYPSMQGYYPFGAFSGLETHLTGYMQTGNIKEYMKIRLDAYSDFNFNIVYDNGPHMVVMFDAKSSPTDFNEFGQWLYGKELPEQGLKAFPWLYKWFCRYYAPLFKPLVSRGKNMLRPDELEQIKKQLQPQLTFFNAIAKKYPQTIAAYIIDDEPAHPAATIAAKNIVEKETGLPALFCINMAKHGVNFAPYAELLPFDWYAVSEYSRDCWVYKKTIQGFLRKCPQTNFWFIPLTGTYDIAHDYSKPGLPDTRLTPAEFRLQCWQMIANGAKGIVCFQLGTHLMGMNTFSGLLNSLQQPRDSAGQLHVAVKELAEYMTAVGPLLLSCHWDPSIKAEVASGRVRFPEFKGPAIDYSVLKDIKHDRYYLVPWNNDILKRQNGKITLPSSFAGKNVYDMGELKLVAVNEGQFSVSLEPGEGKIFLISSENEFNAAREVVLRHRTHNEFLAAWRKYRVSKDQGLDLARATALFDRGKEAEKNKQWVEAMDGYTKTVNAIKMAEGRSILITTKFGYKFKPNFRRMRSALDDIARTLSETSELVQGYGKVLDTADPKIDQTKLFKNKYIKNELREWMFLARSYYAALIRFREGKFIDETQAMNEFTLEDELTGLLGLVEKNKQAFQKIINARLKEVRIPGCVALITPDRTTIDYNVLYSWALDICDVKWFAPDKRGELTDRDGEPFVNQDFDVIWVHQLSYQNEVPQNEKLTPEKALMPILFKPDIKEKIKKTVFDGGGMLLSGIAGLYTIPLGVESELPDHVCELSHLDGAHVFSIVPNPACDEHPVLKGIPASGMITNDTYGHFDRTNMVIECAWEKKSPSGIILGRQKDDTGHRGDKYASVVEYKLGKGRVLVFGGLCVDMNPGEGYTAAVEPLELRQRIRTITRNALEYLESDKKFEFDSDATSINSTKVESNEIILPLEGWYFKTDPKKQGKGLGWYKKDFNAKDWGKISVGKNWEKQGFADYNGFAWYRKTFTVANRSGKKAMLYFGGVDAEATVYLDGKLIGIRGDGANNWSKPFSFDITKYLSDQPKEHLLVVEVNDITNYGGIYRPVVIKYE